MARCEADLAGGCVVTKAAAVRLTGSSLRGCTAQLAASLLAVGRLDEGAGGEVLLGNGSLLDPSGCLLYSSPSPRD